MLLEVVNNLTNLVNKRIILLISVLGTEPLTSVFSLLRPEKHTSQVCNTYIPFYDQLQTSVTRRLELSDVTDASWSAESCVGCSRTACEGWRSPSGERRRE